MDTSSLAIGIKDWADKETEGRVWSTPPSTPSALPEEKKPTETTPSAVPATGGGIGVFTILGLIFVTLKLMGYIHWSWWLVTLPFWGGIALIIILLILGTAVSVIR